MPEVTSIGSDAFYNCGSLTDVSMPEVTSIGSRAFYNCGSLTSVSMPEVTSIDSNAFDGCGSLTDVSMPKVTSISGYAFYNCGSLTSLIIPSSVTLIGEGAFSGCNSLINVHIVKPSNITSLNVNSFTNVYDKDSTLTYAEDLPASEPWITISTYYATKILQSVPICYNEGTKILCLNKHFEEEYIAIENLRKGDLVKTYKHGFKKIDLIGKNRMINDPKEFNKCTYKMEKTNENGLIEDLVVTGGHSILVDDLKECKEENDVLFGGKTPIVDDKYFLLSSVSKHFSKMENTEIYTYYHFVLENETDRHFGVWANGILSESTTKKILLIN
jgi:hypothetical protein